MRAYSLLSLLPCVPLLVSAQCPEYIDYAKQVHEPLSSGKYKLAYQRPTEECRTFKSQGLEDVVSRMQSVIKDPDLARLFQNAYPNTLDTAIKWKGYAADNDKEELTFVITGDINAMWIRGNNGSKDGLKVLTIVQIFRQHESDAKLPADSQREQRFQFDCKSLPRRDQPSSTVPLDLSILQRLPATSGERHRAGSERRGKPGYRVSVVLELVSF